MGYEDLLKRGMEKVPEKLKEKGRFETPRAEVKKAGQRTEIRNFRDIADTLRRKPRHLLKYLLKELATKGEVEGKKLVVLGNFSSNQVNRKLKAYVKDYVICPECGRPDTKLKEEEGVTVLVCEACGARHPVG